MARSLHRYSAGAIVLHWLIAVLIFLNIWQGLKMDSSEGLVKFTIFQNHKTVGISILILSLARLGWRLAYPPPTDPPGRARWETLLAHIVHWAFYAFMIAMPITGWLAVSASPRNLPTVLFHNLGLPGVPWPNLPVVSHLPIEQKRAIEKWAWDVHDRMVWGGYALIALHVAGALKHQFGPNPVLQRMLPFLRPRPAA